MNRFFGLIAVLIFAVNTPVRSEGINTGVESLLLPIAVVASPFIIVSKLLFGSDSDAMRSAETTATKILEEFNSDLPVTGLNLGPLDAQMALYGMLVESRIPFVEISTGSIDWLISKSDNPLSMASIARQSKWIRLSLGERTNSNCFPWKSDYHDFTTKPPVRPNTCLVATFENDSASNLRLDVNTTKVSSRELRWDLVDQATNKILLSVPFWETQVEGQKLRVTLTYRDHRETYPFVRLVKKLTPAFPGGRLLPEANSHVMSWIGDVDRSKEVRLQRSQVKGMIRAVELDWRAPDPSTLNESWASGYRRAQSTGKPVLLNNTLLIIPMTSRIGPACANRIQDNCDFARNFLSDLGVITTNSTAATPGFKSSTLNSPANDLHVSVVGRSFEGDVFWYVNISPQAFPDNARFCSDLNNRCRFYVQDVRVTDFEFAMLGKFSASATLPDTLKNQDFELVVPLTDIPAATYRP